MEQIGKPQSSGGLFQLVSRKGNENEGKSTSGMGLKVPGRISRFREMLAGMALPELFHSLSMPFNRKSNAEDGTGVLPSLSFPGDKAEPAGTFSKHGAGMDGDVTMSPLAPEGLLKAAAEYTQPFLSEIDEAESVKTGIPGPGNALNSSPRQASFLDLPGSVEDGTGIGTVQNIPMNGRRPLDPAEFDGGAGTGIAAAPEPRPSDFLNHKKDAGDGGRKVHHPDHTTETGIQDALNLRHAAGGPGAKSDVPSFPPEAQEGGIGGIPEAYGTSGNPPAAVAAGKKTASTDAERPSPSALNGFGPGVRPDPSEALSDGDRRQVPVPGEKTAVNPGHDRIQPESKGEGQRTEASHPVYGTRDKEGIREKRADVSQPAMRVSSAEGPESAKDAAPFAGRGDAVTAGADVRQALEAVPAPEGAGRGILPHSAFQPKTFESPMMGTVHRPDEVHPPGQKQVLDLMASAEAKTDEPVPGKISPAPERPAVIDSRPAIHADSTQLPPDSIPESTASGKTAAFNSHAADPAIPAESIRGDRVRFPMDAAGSPVQKEGDAVTPVQKEGDAVTVRTESAEDPGLYSKSNDHARPTLGFFEYMTEMKKTARVHASRNEAHAGLGNAAKEQIKPLQKESFELKSAPGTAKSASGLPPVSGKGAGSPAPPAFEPSSALRQSVIQQVVPSMIRMVRQGETRVTLALRPNELGAIRIQLDSERGTLNARFFVESDEVKGLVEHTLPELRSQLEREGIKIDGVQVHLNPQHSQSADSDSRLGRDDSHPGFTERRGFNRRQPPEEEEPSRVRYFGYNSMEITV